VKLVDYQAIYLAAHMLLDVGRQRVTLVSPCIRKVTVRVIGNRLYLGVECRLFLDALQILKGMFTVNEAEVRDLYPFLLLFRHTHCPQQRPAALALMILLVLPLEE
jgi:hypothetical protein